MEICSNQKLRCLLSISDVPSRCGQFRQAVHHQCARLNTSWQNSYHEHRPSGVFWFLLSQSGIRCPCVKPPTEWLDRTCCETSRFLDTHSTTTKRCSRKDLTHYLMWKHSGDFILFHSLFFYCRTFYDPFFLTYQERKMTAKNLKMHNGSKWFHVLSHVLYFHSFF